MSPLDSMTCSKNTIIQDKHDERFPLKEMKNVCFFNLYSRLFQDSTLIMQLLRDNLTLWTSDTAGDGDDGNDAVGDN
jgi:hypothetical protein